MPHRDEKKKPMYKAENNPFEHLQEMLKKQRDLIKKGELRAAERLSKQIEQMTAEILNTGTSEQSECSGHYDQLLDSYKEVEFILESQKNIVEQQLKKIAAGKKIIQAYNT